MKWLKHYSLPILSAVLAVTSFIPFPPWAVFFCYTPLWFFALRQNHLKPLLIGSWLCQFLITAGGFNWLVYTISEFGGFSKPLSILIFLGYAVFANLHIPLASAFWFWSKNILQRTENKIISTVIPLLLLPVYFALSMEYYPMIFDWHFGYTWFYADWPAAQTAEIWGFSFINTLTLLSNLLFLFIIKNFSFRNLLILLSLWLISFAGLNFLGKSLQKNLPAPNRSARVLIVQPGQQNKNQIRRKHKDIRPVLMNNLIQETKKYFTNTKNPKKIDFILWPESAFPYFINLQSSQGKNIAGYWAKYFNTPLALAASRINKNKAANSFFIFDKTGKLTQEPYDKMKLMAFGEYLPGEEWLPLKKWLAYYHSSFQKGSGKNKIQNLEDLKLGMQICYEGLFDRLTTDLAKEGANILVNVTNDSWYGHWQEPYQHLYMTLARAVEVRRPMVRGTLTGLSAVISAKGRIDRISTMNQPSSWLQEIPYIQNPRQTLFTKGGFYINTVFLWLLWVLCFLYWLKKQISL